MSGLSDSEERRLVQQAQSGDAAALDRLLESHRRDLARRAGGRLPPPVRRRLADSDLVQETLLIAAQQIENFEYRGDGSFRAWLQGIAEIAARRALRYHIGTQKRAVGAEVTRGQRPQTVNRQAERPSPSNLAMGEEMKERVAVALAAMPEDYRTVIQLLQHRRRTIAETAELMGRSANAVKKLHGRALTDLAARLKRAEEGQGD